MTRLNPLTPLLISLLLISCGPSVSTVGIQEATSEKTQPRQFSSWTDSVLAHLTLEEKVGQLIASRAYGHYFSDDGDEFQRLTQLVTEQKVGGLVLFQGDVYESAILLNKLQQVAKVPLLISADFERGMAMRLRRGTYFPDAMAIGATRNTRYAYEVGHAIAEEARAVGIHQNLAPVADVNNNIRNPVINTRAFAGDQHLVAEMVEAFVKGTNDGGAISTAKHFPGHGDTDVDSHLDLPVLPFDRQRLDTLELVSFKRAIDGGVKSIMVAHLAIPSLDSVMGIPATLSEAAVNGVLKKELGVNGLIVTDALEMAGITRGFSAGDAAVRALYAGVDMLLLPADEDAAMSAILRAIRRGEISEARLDVSVRKILEMKEWLHLDHSPCIDVEKVSDHVASREHLKLAKDIARDAITIVRNEGTTLPLLQNGSKNMSVVIVSDVDDNRTEVNRANYPFPNEPVGLYFMQQLRRRWPSADSEKLTPSSNTAEIEAVLSRLKRADIVVLPLYVKVRTSSGRIGIPDNLESFVEKVAGLQKPTVIISFGNPYLVGEFPKAQALMCVYSDAEVLVESAVEAMFGEIEVHGKLPVTIPDKFPIDTGVPLTKTTIRKDDPLYAGFDRKRLHRLDSILVAAIRDSAFPAAQLAVVKDGIMVYNRSFGTYTYEPASREISSSTLFDVASVTKVIATTSAMMKLYDEGRLSLSDPVSRYIPQFSGGKKDSVTIRHLLTHSAGLPPFKKLWEICKTKEEALDTVFGCQLIYSPGDSMVYSDLGFITLGKVVEKITGMPLDEYVRQTFFQPLGMNNTGFTPTEAIFSRIAPTEIATTWRKKTVQGTVHDENAGLLGGVSGHAGLFSNVSDLAVFMQMLMNGGTYGGVRYLSDTTVSLFIRKQSARSTRALGWDTKSPTGSSAGSRFSMSSFGHTGFTGTCIWADPERNLFVVFLTNRVHPTRATSKIHKVRPTVHDAVVQALMEDDRRDAEKAEDK